MPLSSSIFPILLVLLLCAGLCGLDWNRLHDQGVPARFSREQVAQVALYEHGDVFVTLFSDSLRLHREPNQADDNTPVVSEPGSLLTVTAPVLRIEGFLSLATAEAQCRPADHMKNKDPPA